MLRYFNLIFVTVWPLFLLPLKVPTIGRSWSNLCKFQPSVTTLLNLFYKRMNKFLIIKANIIIEPAFRKVTKYLFLDT